MSLKQQIDNDIKKAMLAKEKDALRTLRALKSAILLAETEKGAQEELSADKELAILQKAAKQRKESAEIYAQQPGSQAGIWNRLEYRPLEGFVFAVTPFNFTAIAANLSAAPALMGNVVIWKPASSQVYSAQVIMELFKAAGLPDGVINMVTGNSAMITDVLLNSRDFSGVHFTGSTPVFNSFWETIGKNMSTYKTYPRIVGETGGKDFIWAHPTSNYKEVATAISRGAFEYQGQKCSAASRAYIPSNIWPDVKKIPVGRFSFYEYGAY